jgi:hypothetical protein
MQQDQHPHRSVKRPYMPTLVNPVADRIAELVKAKPELGDVDREVLRCALLTLSHRCGELESSALIP